MHIHLYKKMRNKKERNVRTSSTSSGMVAEKMVHCTDSGMNLLTSYICSLNPLESISSASSSTARTVDGKYGYVC